MQACPPFLGICVELLPQLPPYSLETFLFRFIELGGLKTLKASRSPSVQQSFFSLPAWFSQGTEPQSSTNNLHLLITMCLVCMVSTAFTVEMECRHYLDKLCPHHSHLESVGVYISSFARLLDHHFVTIRPLSIETLPIAVDSLFISSLFVSQFQNMESEHLFPSIPSIFKTLIALWNQTGTQKHPSRDSVLHLAHALGLLCRCVDSSSKLDLVRLQPLSAETPCQACSFLSSSHQIVISPNASNIPTSSELISSHSLQILTSLNSLLSSPTALIRECAMIVTELFAPHLQPKQDNPLEATEPLKFEYDGFDRSLPDPSDPVSWSDSDTSVMFQLHSITGVEIDKSDVSRINEWKEEKDRIWKSLLSLNKPNEEEVHNSSSTATADSPITNTPTEQNPISSLRSDCVVESDSQEAPSSEELETWSDSDPDRPLFVRRTQIRKKSKKLEHSFYEIVPFNLDSAVINRIAHSSTLISYDQSINYKLQGSHQPKRSPDDEVLENTFSFDKKDTDWLDVAEVSLTGIVRGLLGMDLNEHPMEAMALLRKIPTAVHSTEPDVVDMALTAARVVATIQNIFDYPEYERVKQEALVSLLVSVKPDVAITLGNLFYSHSVTVANRVGILSSFAASAVFMSAGKSLSEVALQLDDSPPPDPQKEITVSSDTKKTQFNQTKTAESETKKPLIEILGESDPADRIPLDEQNKPIESVSIKPSKTRRWGYTTHNRKPPSPESINAFTPHGPAFFFALLSPLEPKILTSQTHVTYDYRARDAVQLVGDDSYVLSVLLQTLSTILWCTGFSPSPVHSDMPKSFLRAIYNFRPGASPFLLKAILVSIHTCFFCPLSSTTSLSELMNDANETIIWCDALIQNSPDREVYMLASELVLDLKRLYRIT